jgi:hypothetical protein
MSVSFTEMQKNITQAMPSSLLYSVDHAHSQHVLQSRRKVKINPYNASSFGCNSDQTKVMRFKLPTGSNQFVDLAHAGIKFNIEIQGAASVSTDCHILALPCLFERGVLKSNNQEVLNSDNMIELHRLIINGTPVNEITSKWAYGLTTTMETTQIPGVANNNTAIRNKHIYNNLFGLFSCTDKLIPLYKNQMEIHLTLPSSVAKIAREASRVTYPNADVLKVTITSVELVADFYEATDSYAKAVMKRVDADGLKITCDGFDSQRYSHTLGQIQVTSEVSIEKKSVESLFITMRSQAEELDATANYDTKSFDLKELDCRVGSYNMEKQGGSGNSGDVIEFYDNLVEALGLKYNSLSDYRSASVTEFSQQHFGAAINFSKSNLVSGIDTTGSGNNPLVTFKYNTGLSENVNVYVFSKYQFNWILNKDSTYVVDM